MRLLGACVPAHYPSVSFPQPILFAFRGTHCFKDNGKSVDSFCLFLLTGQMKNEYATRKFFEIIFKQINPIRPFIRCSISVDFAFYAVPKFALPKWAFKTVAFTEDLSSCLIAVDFVYPMTLITINQIIRLLRLVLNLFNSGWSFTLIWFLTYPKNVPLLPLSFSAAVIYSLCRHIVAQRLVCRSAAPLILNRPTERSDMTGGLYRQCCAAFGSERYDCINAREAEPPCDCWLHVDAANRNQMDQFRTP